MRVVDELLGSYQHVVESLTLHMGIKGVFDVVVDGDLVYSKGETGRKPEPGEVVGLFRDAYAADVKPYGT